jgi:hypothetical protein
MDGNSTENLLRDRRQERSKSSFISREGYFHPSFLGLAVSFGLISWLQAYRERYCAQWRVREKAEPFGVNPTTASGQTSVQVQLRPLQDSVRDSKPRVCNCPGVVVGEVVGHGFHKEWLEYAAWYIDTVALKSVKKVGY